MAASAAAARSSETRGRPERAAEHARAADRAPAAAPEHARAADRAPAAAAEHARAADAQLAADALEDAVEQLGPFGLYQRYMLVMLCLPNILGAMFSLNYIFVADQVPFRCAVPECEGYGADFSNATLQALLPNVSCQRFSPLLDPDNQTCIREHFHQENTIDCDRFVYENQDTIFAEFDLGCREWLRTLVGTVRNSALPFALLLTGYISDSFGRLSAFCIFSSCAAVLGIVKGFSVNYQMYLAMEFLEAALGYGFNSAAYVMVVELARPPLRATFACATGVAYGAGGVLLAGAARRAGGWRRLLWGAHAAALLLPLYWLLLDESWRWLHARGRAASAAAVLRKAARWNKVILDENTMTKLECNSGDGKKESEPQWSHWARLLKSRVLVWRFALCTWCWVAAAFVYYGLTINSVSLAGDKYVNFALNMAMEIVASLLLMMALERFGRKWSIFTAFVLCGIACVTPYFISHSGTGLGLFFVGKLAITFAFNSIYVFTAELFPTRSRSSALAACSLVGRLGSVLAPQTPLLRLPVQALLYGSCSALAALAVLAVPETKNTLLPSDVATAERIRRAEPEPALPPPPPPPLRRVLPADGDT